MGPELGPMAVCLLDALAWRGLLRVSCSGRLVRATLTLDWAGQARLPRGVSGAGIAYVGECGALLCA